MMTIARSGVLPVHRCRAARFRTGWAVIATATLAGAAGCGTATPLSSREPTRAAVPPSIESVPSATPEVVLRGSTATPICQITGLTRRESSYPGLLVQQTIPLEVFVPACRENGNPVLIVLHGKPFDESHWDELGLDEAVTNAILSGELPPAILVLPRIPEPLFSNTDGGPGSYEQEMLEGLLPFVQESWAAQTIALAGISRGGVWSLEIGLRHPEVFSAVGAFSPALAVNRARAEYDPLAIASAGMPLPSGIFLGAGDTDWARAKTEALSRALDSAGAPHEMRLVAGSHEAATWSALLDPFILFLSGAWQGVGIP